MVVNKRKKVVKYRSHTTHGGGHRKKRRGAGSRGGKGNAGSGKRAGHRVNSVAKRLGAKGFLPRRSVVAVKTVNLGFFTDSKLAKLVAAGKVAQKGDTYEIDAAKLGFNKLLATGNISVKLNITVAMASTQAQEKVQTAGGSVTLAPGSVEPKAVPAKKESAEKKEKPATEEKSA